jgi:MoaA/NifB/PqqE/SkfB family radical SAM enzyme
MTNFYWKKFPIKTATACQSKWAWSTIWLNEGATSSCHRNWHWQIDPNNFDNFHNLPEKLEDRQKMLEGKWPEGVMRCDYCKKVEEAGGYSDRMHNNSLGGYTPDELYKDPTAVIVSPKIIEIFASNTCNLACIYCDENLSSKIENENRKFGNFHNSTIKNPDQDKMYKDFLNWLENNIQKIVRLHLLGGETFIQHDLMNDILDIIERKPNRFLQLNIFSNFNAPEKFFYGYFDKIKDLALAKNIGRFDLTCSIDCWGPEQTYVRSGINLDLVESYLDYVTDINEKWLYLNINQTITSMTIKSMPLLLDKIKKYKMKRQLGHYFTVVDGKDEQLPQNYNYNLWEKDFEIILKKLSGNDYESQDVWNRMSGINEMLKTQCQQNDKNIKVLHDYLDELDRRRGTNWRQLFPYLIV